MDGEEAVMGVTSLIFGGPELSETDLEIVIRRDLAGNITAYVGDYHLKNVVSIEQTVIIRLKDGTNINLNTSAGARAFAASKISHGKAQIIISADKEAGI